jgi:hypothetical protein
MKLIVMPKKLIVSLIVLLLFNSANAYCQIDSVSTSISTEKPGGLCYTISGGIGMTTGSTQDIWEDKFNNGPAACLGAEIYLRSFPYLSLEVSGHYWIAKLKNPIQYSIYDHGYIKNSENLYSQIGITPALKIYFADDNSKFRIFIYGGILLYTTSMAYKGFDFGFGLCYRLNKNIEFNISRRIIKGNISFINCSFVEVTPNYLLLTTSYNINR